jgi:hypothetical protein
MATLDLLRYRFETLEQARRHLHLMEERQILFFPDGTGRLRERQTVLLELRFDESVESAMTCGEVRALETGAVRGAWVELHSRNLLSELRTAFDRQRRRHQRLPASGMMRTQRSNRESVVGRLTDLSLSGARLSGVMASWPPGEKITMNDLGGGLPLRAMVVRCRAGELAVAFDRSDSQTRVVAGRLFEAASARWKSSFEAHHPIGCACDRGGLTLEPLLPRAAHRRAQSG